MCREVAQLAFRRSLTDDERQRYIDQFFADGEPPREACTRSLIAILKSPWFLYIGLEKSQTPSERIAERLAWYLWDSIPDRRLQIAVNKNQLNDEAAVREIAEKMVDTSAAKAKIREFIVRWLRLDSTSEMAKDPAVFAQFNQDLVDDLHESLLRFVDDCFWGDNDDFRQLLLADYLWLNPRLMEFYGVQAATPNETADDDPFQKVSVDPNQRAGLLTHPLLLSQLAYYRTTSPIHRGVFVSRNLLGIRLSPPPFAIEPLSEDFDLSMTTRQRVEFQTRPDNCMSCHHVINPLGFALESLDAVGRLRETEKDHAVDTRVLVQTDGEQTIELEGPRELAEFLAGSRQTQRHFVETLFHHLVKQPVAAYGEHKLDELTDRFIESGCRIRQLMVDIAVTAAMNEH